MARSIISGLISSGWKADNIRVSDPSEEQRVRLQNQFGIQTYSENAECLNNENAQTDIVVLAIKPQMMRQAINSVAHELLARKPMVISIAAGIRINDISRWIGEASPVIRVMPNTPALVNCGVSGLLANDSVSKEQCNIAESVMLSVGPVVWLDSEHDVDVVTGISGSGPAYYFKLMEIMIESAKANGLSEEAAKTLVLQTALGAATLAKSSEFMPGELRRQVTSPGGTTQAAINCMEEQGVEAVIANGIQAAIEKSDELAKTLGTD